MVASTVAFAGMHAGVRYLSIEQHLHPFEIAFFRNFFGFLVLVPWFVQKGLSLLRTQRFGLHTVRALINLVAMLLFFVALSLTPLAQVQALGFTAPLFATLLAVLVLREKVFLWRWGALIVGFIGALIIIRPGLKIIDVGSLFVLSSAAIWAGTIIIIKILSRTDSSVTITAYMVLLMTPLSLIPAVFYWQWPDFEQWLWLVFVGMSGTLAQLGMAQAFRVAEATAVLPFDFMKLVWGAAIGYLLFAEVPDVGVWIGGTTIFAAATYIAYRESQTKAKPATASLSDTKVTHSESGPGP
jgi:drug/metabolite transporter (DMT)-like permease